MCRKKNDKLAKCFTNTQKVTVPVRVYVEDTDAGGIVFYANYLRYMERARTEWLREVGFDRFEFMRQENQFVVSELSIKYLLPLVLDQEVVVTAEILESNRVRCIFYQEILSIGDSNLHASANVEIVCVETGKFRPKPLPKILCKV